MLSIIVDGEELKLSETVVRKLGGHRIVVVETGEGILLRPADDSLLTARGLLEGRGLSTKEFFEMKREEKGLEQ